MSDWIPVSERLPDYDTPVLAVDGASRDIFVAWRMEDENDPERGEWLWWDNDGYGPSVTHWMPLPPIPQRRRSD